MRTKQVVDSSKDRGTLDCNQIVASNLRRARECVGWTQCEVASRLAEMTGLYHSKATVSAMERSAVGGTRRRRFDAQDLVQFARLFGLPVTWFMTPSVEQCAHEMRGLDGDTGVDVIGHVVGSPEAEDKFRERLSELADAGVGELGGGGLEQRRLRAVASSRALKGKGSEMLFAAARIKRLAELRERWDAGDVLVLLRELEADSQ